MERQCKIGGEGLRNRDVVMEDRISELPEALLLEILSLLPTKIVIATSVFSKRWRSLWKMVPNLKFDSYRRHHTFSENVCRSLISNQAPFLESLHLEVEDMDDALDVGIWIGIAFAHHVRELVLDFSIQEDGLVSFPSVLCRCNNTLKILKLKYSIHLDLPYPVCFNSLRELHLYFVDFKDTESVSNLLCGCPSLEDLVVDRPKNLDLEIFTIAVPSLQRLTLKDDFEREGKGGYVIKTPSLKYLNIEGIQGLEFCLIENLPELVEAKIIDVFGITNENILESLTSVNRLSVHSSYMIKYPTGFFFYQLVSLELRINYHTRWTLLLLMLDSSPNLQILKLIDPWWNIQKDYEWDQPKCVPECLLSHLETFVWKRYKWQREEDKEVATYILKNARQLKKATFSAKPIRPENLEKLEKRREMLNELASVVRASNSCHLVLESPTY